jgi:hypothetical protein
VVLSAAGGVVVAGESAAAAGAQAGCSCRDEPPRILSKRSGWRQLSDLG